MTQNLAEQSPQAFQLRAKAHFQLAEALWNLDEVDSCIENYESAIRLAEQGGFELDIAHYAANFAGVYVIQASDAADEERRKQFKEKAMKFLERAEQVSNDNSADAKRTCLLAQYQRADMLSWVDGKPEEGIELLRKTIDDQIAQKSRATVDALEISFPQLWSTLVENGENRRSH